MKADALPGNPLFEGSVRAHEYHYSEVMASEKDTFGFEVKRGLGISGKKDGLVFRNTMGTYIHQHALSTKDWAVGLRDRLD